jgi:polyisoprenoid-binding protein YceI
MKIALANHFVGATGVAGMRDSYPRLAAAFFLMSLSWLAPSAHAQQHAIDMQKSKLTVRVYKSGVFSAFAHDHEVAAPILRGTAEISDPASVKLEVDARALQVVDPNTSEKDRSEIQKTMLGPDVLDSERFHEIVFQSTAVEQNGAQRWVVHGNLTLHGQSAPVTVDVLNEAGHYTGRATVKQTSFGIKPVRIGGGTVKVKDEVRIEFDVQLAP